MAAPVFISYTASSSFLTTTTPKTANVSVKIGDVIVVKALCEAADASISTPTDTVNAYTVRQTVDSANALDAIAMGWTAVAATETTLTISVARTGTAREYGFGVDVWRSASVGTSASNGPNGGTAGAPSQNITTTAPNSGLSIANSDWNAVDGTTRTWRTVNGSAAMEDTYARDASAYTAYVGHHLDAGVVGTKTVGLSAPAGQKYSILVIEILGIPMPELTVARFVP